MSKPMGVAVDPAGNVFVADTGNNQVDEFNRNNVVLSTVGANSALAAPGGAAVDSNGNLDVADTKNNRVVRFSPTGAVLDAFNLSGNGANGDQMNQPTGVAVDSANNIYVADRGNNQVEEFTPTGQLVRAFTASGTTSGSNANKMSGPSGVTVDANGNVYVADTGNNRVEKLSPTGTVLATFNLNGLIANGVPAQMSKPSGVAVDSAGNIYVADTGDNRVVELDPAGAYLRAFTASGLSGGGGTLNGPTGVAVDSAGDVYVADTGNKPGRGVLARRPLPAGVHRQWPQR
jgi:sugar lactone lactonase YvrE